MEKGLDKLIGYKKGFAFANIIVLISVALMFLFGVVSIILYQKAVRKNAQEIYVLTPSGMINQALKVERSMMRKYEYQDVMKRVFMFLYEHDEHNFQDRLEQANNILGDPGIRITKEFEQENHLKRLREYNLILRMEITGYQVDEANKTGIIEGVQTVLWKDQSKKIRYQVRCKFQDMISNSEKNPHGIKIIMWEEVLEQVIEK